MIIYEKGFLGVLPGHERIDKKEIIFKYLNKTVSYL
jgi:hypothetical protein